MVAKIEKLWYTRYNRLRREKEEINLPSNLEVMPIEFKKYFWDTDFDKLDLKENRRYIIARLYCYGDLKAIRWLKNTYTDDEIKDVAINSRNLNPLVANYLRQQYNLKKEEMAYYKAIMAMNYEYWRVNK